MFRRRASMVLCLAVLGVVTASAPASAGTGRTVSGTVFEDLDGDGVLDLGEPGVEDCTVSQDVDDDGTVENSTLTSPDGTWILGGITTTNPVAFFIDTCGFDTNSSPAELVLPPTADPVTDANFGLFDNGQVFGDVFNDTDGDGTQDAGEDFIDGCTVTLDQGADGSVDDDTTTTDGFFFSNLGPGTIRLRASCPGLGQTTPDPADIVVSSGLDLGGILFGFNAQAGTTTTATTAATPVDLVPAPSSTVLARTGPGPSNGGVGATGFALVAAGVGCVMAAARRRARLNP